MNTFGLNATLIMIVGTIIGAIISWLFLKEKLKRQDSINQEGEKLHELSIKFQQMANENFKITTENFLKLAEENSKKQQQKSTHALGNLIDPINKTIEATNKQIDQIEKDRKQDYGNIGAQIKTMTEGNKSLSETTDNLVNALRKPEIRGSWGEIGLKRVAEYAGMIEHCDFLEQVHEKTDSSFIRPDMIIKLPEQRDLIVDAKTPIDAYLEATKCKDELEKNKLLKKHSKNIRNHVRQLSGKEYWNQFPHSPEYVILYLNIEQILSVAISKDPELIDYALSRKIIIATPSSLTALLKSIAMGWKQFALTENAINIKNIAVELHSRLSVFSDHLDKLGGQLSSSVDNYNKAVGSYQRKILPSARKMEELGVIPKKELKQLKKIEKEPRQIKKD